MATKRFWDLVSRNRSLDGGNGFHEEQKTKKLYISTAKRVITLEMVIVVMSATLAESSAMNL